jgi:tetratricopeptide (TPR) repeat protein
VISAILVLAAAQAAAPTVQHPETARFAQCAALARSNPDAAVEEANRWRDGGGGPGARQCLGMAYTTLERWQPAAVAFEQAAREADTRQDPRRGDLWGQAGNAWLAADDAAQARAAFDAALATTALTSAMRGEIHLDRARALVALGDAAGARADLDKGLELVPADPFGWYLSAALAMRQEQLARAQQDIAKAIQLAPGDPDILLLAGNIAAASGEPEAAHTFYNRAISAAPRSEAARNAQAALTANAPAAPTTERTGEDTP